LGNIRMEGLKDLLPEDNSYFPFQKFQTETEHTKRDENDIRPIRLDKLLVEAAFVSSRTEAGRKIKEKAVRLNSTVVDRPILTLFVPCELVTALGRKTKIVSIVE